MAKRGNNINKTLATPLIFSGAVLIILAFVLMRVENIIGWIGSLLGILRPIFIGIVLTFILYGPTVKLTQLLEKATKGRKFPCNGVAVLISYVAFFGIVTGLIWIVVPSFIESIEEFATKFSGYVANIQSWLDNIISMFSDGSGVNIVEQLSLNADEILGQKKLIRDYSAGNKQKIGIISALINNPSLLILDEPFNFLDPSSQNILKKVLVEYNKQTGATILVSSHNLQHTIEISSRIALLEQGKIIKDLSNEGGGAEQELEAYFNV